MVADVMTSEGEVRAIGRHGVSETKHSILARAFGYCKPPIEGRNYWREGQLNWVENIIVGQPISLGKVQ